MSHHLQRVLLLTAVLLFVGFQADRPISVVGQDKPKAGTRAAKNKAPAKTNLKILRAEIKIIDQVELAAARAGILDFVEPSEGDEVRADQKIAGLKDAVAQAELRTAKAQAENDIEIRYAKENFRFAKMDYNKSIDANKRVKQAFSEIDLQEKLLAAEKAKLQIEQAEWQFKVNKVKAEQAEAVLDEFSITAPFDGVVTKVLKSKGEAVQVGDTILQVTSTNRMRVEGYLPYVDAIRVKKGDPVTVQLNLADGSLEAAKRTFRGRVKSISEEVTPIEEAVLIWAEVENVDNLMRAGLEATMTIDLLGSDSRNAGTR